MPKLDPEKLDEVIESSGLGERAAKKLRDANQKDTPQPRGHGAPAQDMTALPEL